MDSQLWKENTVDSWTTQVKTAGGHLHADFKPVLFKEQLYAIKKKQTPNGVTFAKPTKT